MGLIQLSNGMFAEVSDHRLEELSRYRWGARRDRKNGKWYAIRALLKVEGSGSISMHRQIMGCTKGDGKEVDHIRSEETLNNRDNNLRFATRAQQNQNRGARKDNTTGYRGVSKVPKKPGWYKTQVWIHGTNTVVWTGTDPKEGFEVYITYVHLLHGEFARFD